MLLDPHFDRTKLLALMRTEYEFAERTLLLVSEAQIFTPGVVGHWSVKDVIAHLTAWEVRTLRWLDDADRGIPLTHPEAGFGWGEAEFERLNDKHYQISRDRLPADILADFRRVQGQMLARVEALTDAELAGGGRYTRLFRDSPAEAIYSNTAHHYDLHLGQIRAWLSYN